MSEDNQIPHRDPAGTATSTVTLRRASGGFYAVVTFPPGLFRGRDLITGPVMADPGNAVASAYAVAAQVIVDICTSAPAPAPDYD